MYVCMYIQVGVVKMCDITYILALYACILLPNLKNGITGQTLFPVYFLTL